MFPKEELKVNIPQDWTHQNGSLGCDCPNKQLMNDNVG